ncbi:hypothetical protein [Halorussus lipolyticus]|uniref:hypothetical protein n=1 Tax=Halorussus lipolyticus TaxID=3034024 RepID=UPI0023E777E1|nr:hypothetical protein [Halorussus sp. DT80]
MSATDSHGNTKTKTAIRRANALGRLAGELDADNIYLSPVARKLGRFSGFSAGVGGTVKSLLSFVRDPLGFVESLGELIELVDESGLGIVSMMIEAMGENLQNKQETNNPYEKGTALYDDFRYNWWAGYTVAFIAKALVGAQATKAPKPRSTPIQSPTSPSRRKRARRRCG